MLPCSGEGRPNGDHCCYLDGVRCPYLVENANGRRYACSIRLKYDSWEEMNASDEYHYVGKFWELKGLPFNMCELSDPAFCCRPEGKNGRTHQDLRIN